MLEKLREYKELKLAIEQQEKRLKKLNEAIKQELEQAGTNVTTFDGYKFERIVSRRQSIDEAGVVHLLKSRGLTDAIKTEVVERVDEAKTMAHIEEGKLSADEVGQYLTVKEIVSLRMTKSKEVNE